MGSKPHLLLIPYPAQGHVAPLLKLATKIAEHGIKITFVNTEYIEAKILASGQAKAEEGGLVRLVSIPDGLDDDDRNDKIKMTESLFRVLPGHLKELIEKMNQSDDCEPISCVVADICVGWALEIAHEMGIPGAAFVPFGPPNLAFLFQVKRLIDSGIIDTNGNSMNDELISVSEETIPWKKNEYPWSCPAKPETQKMLFKILIGVAQTVRISNWVLCNSIYELDSLNCDLVPKILPIGPILASNHSGNSAGSLILEDPSCLNWLDEQATGSVIYVALGSTTRLNQQQFDELALGLESSGLPFLWVVRWNLVKESFTGFPDGFKERIAGHGKIVEWAAQEKVLAHPSVACFLSHCGWNSTMEGLSMGVPFLCWPYFADQHLNRNYICEAWKIGIDLILDDNGIVTKHEIKRKVEKLLNDEGIKANALKLKEIARRSLVEGGSSCKNFKRFVNAIKYDHVQDQD
ncbi:UDP-glycosyltransferase 83A1-like [Mangifera indica]|uniref:UDP-glycosyltransferase 83A1-like n=1 Tax=Mangifera indica TaxID=29780 RepID=UPI001CFC049B|nr:UDP-glycosyltransferase 83A1-like [Mangifera indica]